VAGWLRGTGFFVMVEVGISLAIAAIPEALPAVTTLILALGVLHLARNHAIVRRLASVETLGATTVICTDKTGTLTQNLMAVREYRLADGRKIDPATTPPARQADTVLVHALRVGVLCSDAGINSSSDDQDHFVGGPTETALLRGADDLGIDIAGQRSANPKIREVPFDATTRLMTTSHRTSSGGLLLVLKGAPSAVLDSCASYAAGTGIALPLDAEARARFRAVNDDMAARAMRVLGLAERQDDDDERDPGQTNSGYTFLGFAGMMDPPRPAVAEALRRARRAGIRVVMLTGDQVNTARAIARELGIGAEEPDVVHARELAGIEPQALAELAWKADAFARVSPEDKLRIVEALQHAGEVVAVTGDGVNDAPALKRADIGIAMGRRGTEVAKEAADVVLTDDNFATLVLAVEAGRAIYTNITRFIHLMFSKNLGAVLAIFAAIASGWPLPLLPLQILWINLVTDVFPAMALAVEPPTPGAMRRDPRPSDAALLSRPFLLLIAWQGVMMGSLILAFYWWAVHRYGPGPHARTIAMMTLIGGQLGHMFNCRSRTRSALVGLLRNPFVWAAAGIVVALQIAAVYLSPLAAVLGTVRPEGADWIIVTASIVLPVAVVELSKLLGRRPAGNPAGFRPPLARSPGGGVTPIAP
jgi:Ca2+-transporting ATPase